MGQYHCTVVCGRAVLPGGFLADGGAQVAKLQWAAGDHGGDEWADCAGVGHGEALNRDEAGSDAASVESLPEASEASATADFARRSAWSDLPAARPGGNGAWQVVVWGDNEHGELSDSKRSVLPKPVPLNWRALAPWEQVSPWEHTQTTRSRAKACALTRNQ